MKSKGHPILKTIALLSLLAGGALLTLGILRVVDEATNLRDGSVASGQVALPNGDPVVTEFNSSGSTTYTVYVTPKGMEAIRKILRDLADRGNVPSIRHGLSTRTARPLPQGGSS